MLVRVTAADSKISVAYAAIIRIAGTNCTSQPTTRYSNSRHASSSSKRWQTRQENDKFSREAKVQGLKSRAAFKLLEINEKYKLFKKGQTVVDLGYAPGSWSQVAVNRTSPDGKVIGIDIIPAQPPKGVSTIQGDFLSDVVQEEVKRHLRDLTTQNLSENEPEQVVEPEKMVSIDGEPAQPMPLDAAPAAPSGKRSRQVRNTLDMEVGRMVDVVLSDMSEPWMMTTGFSRRTLSKPYYRMMNTSGTKFRDHAGSMDLCNAALRFSFDTLKQGGSFLCKYYSGAEGKALEKRLKVLFSKVHREKPESSRKESKEAYFVALRRKADVKMEEIFTD